MSSMCHSLYMVPSFSRRSGRNFSPSHMARWSRTRTSPTAWITRRRCGRWALPMARIPSPSSCLVTGWWGATVNWWVTAAACGARSGCCGTRGRCCCETGPRTSFRNAAKNPRHDLPHVSCRRFLLPLVVEMTVAGLLAPGTASTQSTMK